MRKKLNWKLLQYKGRFKKNRSQRREKRIKKDVIKKNKEEIEEVMKKGKKTKYLNECNKEYMSKLNFNKARMIFLLKSNMVKTKANFKGQFLNDLKCEMCGKEETTQYLFECDQGCPPPSHLVKKVWGPPHLLGRRGSPECDGYTGIRKNIRIEDTAMKTLWRNNIKAIAEVMSKILEKSRRIMEEKYKPVTKNKTEGWKEKEYPKKHTASL